MDATTIMIKSNDGSKGRSGNSKDNLCHYEMTNILSLELANEHGTKASTLSSSTTLIRFDPKII
ncbi:hypothetical protein BUE80_DR000962 [Diplocarpon rosae]|nr:hypothetical protein BUE80_DR000962 [Diplocarpon rosae]